MIVGAAVLPTAPLLVPGVSATLPHGVPRVLDAVDAAVDALPAADVTVLVAGGDGCVHARARASLRGIGRADITLEAHVAAEAAAEVAAATGLPLDDAVPLPLDLAVLALHLGDAAPVVAVTVPAGDPFESLTAIGTSIAEALADPDLRVCVVAAGDLSAGLTERSPLHLVSGAIFWDEQAVAAVDSGRLQGLARLGPEEARRVGARAWAPLTVLHGVTARVKVGMVVRHYSAPRGVGYLVASGG